ncbi:hypothetical protein ABTQ09_19520, partial [Acinetobacter baumannii]
SVGWLLHILLDLFNRPGVPLLTPQGMRIAFHLTRADQWQFTISTGLFGLLIGYVLHAYDRVMITKIIVSPLGIPMSIAQDVRWMASFIFGTP